MTDDVPPIPEHPQPELVSRLRAARRRAVTAILQAETVEAEARKVRRTARRNLKSYERLLAENAGQLALPLDDVTQAS